MPSITDLKKLKKTKIFEKKEYRPWDEKSAISLSQNTNNSVLKNENLEVNTKLKDHNTDNLNSVNLEKVWRYLYGAKKVIFEQILKNIEETHEQHVITYPLTTPEIATDTLLPQNTIRSATQRLKKEGLIFFHEKKTGKGGFARYSIPLDVYKFFIKKFSQDI